MANIHEPLIPPLEAINRDKYTLKLSLNNQGSSIKHSKIRMLHNPLDNHLKLI